MGELAPRHTAVVPALDTLVGVTSTHGRLRRRRRPNRDRHGRGLRGSLYPSTLPAASTRAERFDALVLAALEPIEVRWRTELTKLDIAVDDVPDIRGEEEAADGTLTDAGVPLARLVPAGVDRRGQPTKARIVLFRRPLEARARDGADLADLVHHVLVEQVANYLGVDPTVIDGEA
jgi:predicted Zn-dependent protease with MMP-like domain